MFLGLVFLVCLLTVPLLGGRLLALGELQLRSSWLALAGIGVQVLIISVLPAELPGGVAEVLHLASYALLGSFAWLNRRVPGVWVIACGGLLNFVAIAANGGVMPADPSLAVHAAGGDRGFVNAGAVEGARLAFLGDVLATPSWLPLYNVYSAGDVVVVLGVLVLLHRACGSRLPALRSLSVPLAFRPRRDSSVGRAHD